MKKITNGHRWTDGELKQLIGYCYQAKDTSEMASLLNVSRFAINKQISRLRKEGVPIPMRRNGHKAGRHNQPWTQEEIEYLFRRREDSITAEQIAVELDRSILSIQGMIQKLRKEEIPVKMLGQGVRRLWNPDILKIAIAGRELNKSMV